MKAAGNIVSFPKERSRLDGLVEVLHGGFKPAGPEWLRAVNERGFRIVQDRGLPTPKLERWKYTSLLQGLKADHLAFAPANVTFGKTDLKIGRLEEDAPAWLHGLMAEPADGADYGYTALRLLNDAFLRDAYIIDVPAKAAMQTLEITIEGKSGAFHAPRLIIRMGEGAQLTIIEKQVGTGAYWKSGVTQILMGTNAALRHVRVQEDSREAVNTHATHIWLERDAAYHCFALTTGGRLSRHQVLAVLEGAGAHCSLSGINLQRGAQQADTTTLVEHRAAHCTSNQLLRTVLDDQARGVCQGKVYVARDAQKTDGYQLSNTLLLSEGAEMDTKPELEIYADDVKCSHGATTGRLDEEPLFYMRARGIPEAEARALLIEAFLQEAIDKGVDTALAPMLTERVQAWLAR